MNRVLHVLSHESWLMAVYGLHRIPTQPRPSFIELDRFDPCIKDQLRKVLLSIFAPYFYKFCEMQDGEGLPHGWHKILKLLAQNCRREYDFQLILTTWRLNDAYRGQYTRSLLVIIGSDNGLLPDRRQAIIWTSDDLLSIGPQGTNFSKILIKVLKFSIKCIWKCHLQNGSHFIQGSMW